MKKNKRLMIFALVIIGLGTASQCMAMTQEEWENIVRQSRGGDSITSGNYTAEEGS